MVQDKKRKMQNRKNMTGIILISVGIVFITVGVSLLSKKIKTPAVAPIPSIKLENEIEEKKVDVNEKNDYDIEKIVDSILSTKLKNEIVDKKVEATEKNDYAVERIVAPATGVKKDKTADKSDDINEKKGYDFEKFVVKKFSEKYFSIKKWRGDKYVDGRYAEDTPEPDLLLEFKLKEDTSLLAVECKWNAKLYKNGFELSEKDFEKYKQYEAREKIPVFIVVGIGGTADNPESLYLIKLSTIRYRFLKKEFLSKFEKKDKTQNFYFDNTKIELR